MEAFLSSTIRDKTIQYNKFIPPSPSPLPQPPVSVLVDTIMKNSMSSSLTDCSLYNIMSFLEL